MNNTQAEKLRYIYDTYFDPYSEHCLDFNLWDTLDYAGVITHEDNLEHLMETIGERLWKILEEHDKKQLELWKKG